MHVGDSPTQCFQLVVFNITLILNYSSTIPPTPQSMTSFNKAISKSVHILSCRSEAGVPRNLTLISLFLSAILNINFIPDSHFSPNVYFTVSQYTKKSLKTDQTAVFDKISNQNSIFSPQNLFANHIVGFTRTHSFHYSLLALTMHPSFISLLSHYLYPFIFSN